MDVLGLSECIGSLVLGDVDQTSMPSSRKRGKSVVGSRVVRPQDSLRVANDILDLRDGQLNERQRGTVGVARACAELFFCAMYCYMSTPTRRSGDVPPLRG